MEKLMFYEKGGDVSLKMSKVVTFFFTLVVLRIIERRQRRSYLWDIYPSVYCRGAG